MRELSTADVLAVLDCVHALHDLDDYDQLCAEVPQMLAELVPCDSASLTVVGRGRQPVRLYDYPAGALHGHDRPLAHLEPHPAVAFHRNSDGAQACAVSDLLPRQRWHDTQLYQAMFAPYSVEDQLSVAIDVTDGSMVGVGINREQPGFCARDRARLTLTRRALAQAYQRLAPPPEGAKADLLTPREHEVLRLVGQGHTDAQIARRLGTSVRTVQKHLEHVYAKLGVRCRTAAWRTVFVEAVPRGRELEPSQSQRRTRAR